MPDDAFAHPGEQRRSVVLIDEIDKAPRDVPNDILVEIENMQFDIPELSGADRSTVRVALGEDENCYRPIVVFTSNSEKALPDPFLRRCVFHQLPFPLFEKEVLEGGGKVTEDLVTVESIVAARLGARFQGKDETSQRIKNALGFFRFLRKQSTSLERRPGLAELLDWLWYLKSQRPEGTDGDAAGLLTGIKGLLLKKPADQDRAEKLLTDWRSEQSASRD